MALDALTGVLPQEVGRWPQFPTGETLRQQTPSECEIRTNARAGVGNHIAQAGESPEMSGRTYGLKAALGGGWGESPEQPIDRSIEGQSGLLSGLSTPEIPLQTADSEGGF